MRTNSVTKPSIWRALTERLRDESGQLLPLAAGGFIGIAMILALAVNLGNWYSTDAGLQKAADLSAVAGAQFLQSNGTITTPGYPCTGAADAFACVHTVAALNGIAAPETANPTNYLDASGNRGITVTATYPSASGLFMNSTRQKSATAIVAGLGGFSAELPAIFPAGSWVLGQHISWPFGTSQAPGTFNMLASCGSGTNALKQCFKCTQTYTWPAMTPNPLPTGCAATGNCSGGSVANADPGNTIQNPNVVDAINTLSGTVILVPVWSSYTGSGANTVYTIGGYAAILLDNPAATVVGSGSNQTTNINGTFEKVVLPSDVGCGGAAGNFGATSVYLVGA